jgi:drug/metabolite transporter (DMT)-like permease
MSVVLLAVITNIGNVLLDKHALAKDKMRLSEYIPLSFVFLFLVATISLPWTGSINWALAFNQQYIFYFILMILLAILWNMFYYEGLQKEKMIEFEMILLLTPLVTILMAAMFYPEEFNPPVFGAAVVGGLALIFSHLRKHHFQFNKYAVHLVLAVFLMAMEAMVQKELLTIYSPGLLYAVRTACLALFFTIYYRPNMAEVTNERFHIVFLTAIFGAVSMIAKFYGYESIGVTFTTLLLLLSPILVSWIDAKVNKTKIKHRTVIAFTIILLCVVYAIMNQ